MLCHHSIGKHKRFYVWPMLLFLGSLSVLKRRYRIVLRKAASAKFRLRHRHRYQLLRRPLGFLFRHHRLQHYRLSVLKCPALSLCAIPYLARLCFGITVIEWQFIAHLGEDYALKIERPVFNRVVAHLLPGALATRFPCAVGHQAD